METDKVFGSNLNFYQPLRRAGHYELRDLQTSPDGIDHSRKVSKKGYLNLVNGARGSIFADTNYNAYGTLSYEFDRMLAEPIKVDEDPQEYAAKQEDIRTVQEGMREYIAENGTGYTGIHTIMPDHAPRLHKRILFRGGIDHFREQSGGKVPKFVWTGELSLNTDTAEAAVDEGIPGLICAPWQVIQDSGEASDNQLTKVPLPSGRSIVLLPFSRSLQWAISWADERWDVEAFRDKYILPAYDWAAPNHTSHGFNFMVTDGETLGGHAGTEGVDKTFQELVRVALPDKGIRRISINDLDMNDLPTGRLVERSAWSCEHGNLERWHGPCGCHSHEASSQSLEWKTPYYDSNFTLHGSVFDAVDKHLGWSDEELIDAVGGNFQTLLQTPGDEATDPDTSALAAIVSGFAATTSCATFFKSPGTSGYINLLFARQSILHLQKAGLVGDAERIWSTYMKNMSRVTDPETGKTGDIMIEDLLSGNIFHQPAEIRQAA